MLRKALSIIDVFTLLLLRQLSWSAKLASGRLDQELCAKKGGNEGERCTVAMGGGGGERHTQKSATIILPEAATPTRR